MPAILPLTASSARKELRRFANKEKALFLQRFFKTGPGQYAEGDRFIGVTVPETRGVAKRFAHLPLGEIQKLLSSRIHEERLLALLVLVGQAKKTKDAGTEKKLCRFYLKNRRFVNNWDLVDCSAEHIVGAHLFQNNQVPEEGRKLLHSLARSKSVWDRRIALLATFHFIRRGHFPETLFLARALITDKHDLIHKASGWMLREVGNRHLPTLYRFLEVHAQVMPRTMLRYAIEKLPPRKRQGFLKKPLHA